MYPRRRAGLSPFYVPAVAAGLDRHSAAYLSLLPRAL